MFPALIDADPTLFGMPDVLPAELPTASGERNTSKARKRRDYTTRKAFRWAYATVLARAFELPDVGGQMGLCPAGPHLTPKLHFLIVST